MGIDFRVVHTNRDRKRRASVAAAREAIIKQQVVSFFAGIYEGRRGGAEGRFY